MKFQKSRVYQPRSGVDSTVLGDQVHYEVVVSHRSPWCGSWRSSTDSWRASRWPRPSSGTWSERRRSATDWKSVVDRTARWSRRRDGGIHWRRYTQDCRSDARLLPAADNDKTTKRFGGFLRDWDLGWTSCSWWLTWFTTRSSAAAETAVIMPSNVCSDHLYRIMYSLYADTIYF